MEFLIIEYKEKLEFKTILFSTYKNVEGGLSVRPLKKTKNTRKNIEKSIDRRKKK